MTPKILIYCGLYIILCSVLVQEIFGQINNSTNTTVNTDTTGTSNVTVTNVTSVNNSSEVGINGNVTNLNQSIVTDTFANGTNNTNSIETTDVSKTFNIQVSLHYSYDNEFICGGSIISVNQLLTAASCMYYAWGGVLPAIIVQVQTGRNALSETALQSYDVENITFHTNFRHTTLQYNLASIKIKNKFALNSNEAPAIVNETFPGNDNGCILTGWENVSSTLQAIRVNIVSCPITFSLNVICAQTKLSNESLCQHSLGSSLVCGGRLLGILSEQSSCSSTNQLAVFENLTSFNSVRWLQNLDLLPLGSNNTATTVPNIVILLIIMTICLGLNLRIM